MFVRKSMRRSIYALLTAALFLASCTMGATPAPTVDINTINTAAVETAMGLLSSQFTQTALAAPSITPPPTNTAMSLPTTAQATVAGGVAPTVATVAGAPPTVSFNSSPLPGFTALPSPQPAAPTVSLGDSCNNLAFEGDVTIPDGSILPPGQNFDKVWKLRNTGTCAWDDGYAFVYIGGSTPNLDPVNFQFKNSNDFVAGGAAIDMTIRLTTPCQPGKYEGHWRMRSDSGYYFGTTVSVYVEVTDKCK